MRAGVLALLLSLVAGLPAAAHEAYRKAPVADSVPSEPGPVSALPLDLGGPFMLTDADGGRVSDADFRGRYMLLFFGYANCPGLCPLALDNMTAAVELLGPQGAKVTPVLITVDPERDTPQALQAVQSRLGPALVALTGTAEELAAARRAYRVEATATGRDLQGRALFRHGTFIYLVGPDGRVLSLFPPVLDGAALADAVRGYLEAPGEPGS